MGIPVGIIGGTGYAGGELLRLLASHPALDVAAVGSRSAAGSPINAVFPFLPDGGTLTGSTPAAMSGCELVFLATPATASIELAPGLLAEGVKVVDLSGGFRLPAAAYQQWYGEAHGAPDLTPAAYGLPELFRDDVAAADLVASPGCYPTATLLALAPLAGFVEPASVTVVGLSGTSGAGRSLRDDLHASHAAGNITPYSAPGHRHTPEIEAAWQRRTSAPAPVTFVPHLVPIPRGLVTTVTATLLPGSDASEIRDRYESSYAGEPFVRLLDQGAWPQTAYVRGGNGAHVAVDIDDRSGRAIAACAIDNLGKGAAGQAIQNANLLCGLPETAGLSAAGTYP